MPLPDSNFSNKPTHDGLRSNSTRPVIDAEQAGPLPSQGFVKFVSDVQDSLGEFLSAGRHHRGESRVVLTEAERRRDADSGK